MNLLRYKATAFALGAAMLLPTYQSTARADDDRDDRWEDRQEAIEEQREEAREEFREAVEEGDVFLPPAVPLPPAATYDTHDAYGPVVYEPVRRYYRGPHQAWRAPPYGYYRYHSYRPYYGHGYPRYYRDAYGYYPYRGYGGAVRVGPLYFGWR